MKHLTLPSALCLILSGSFAFAQQPQTPAAPQDTQPPAPITRSHDGMQHRHAPDPHRQAMMLTRRLNLTPDQTAKIEPILADRQQKMEALRANTSLSPEDMHQQMRALHEQEKTQFAAILTPDQQQQMKSMRHGHRGRPGAEPQPSASL